jgi:hypothetical protein
LGRVGELFDVVAVALNNGINLVGCHDVPLLSINTKFSVLIATVLREFLDLEVSSNYNENYTT